MKNHESKADILKKGYNRFLVVGGITIAFVAISVWIGKPYLDRLPFIVVLIVVPLVTLWVFAKRNRKKLVEEGINGDEWRGYVWSQPLMTLVKIGLLISVVIDIFRMLK